MVGYNETGQETPYFMGTFVLFYAVLYIYVENSACFMSNCNLQHTHYFHVEGALKIVKVQGCQFLGFCLNSCF